MKRLTPHCINSHSCCKLQLLAFLFLFKWDIFISLSHEVCLYAAMFYKWLFSLYFLNFRIILCQLPRFPWFPNLSSKTVVLPSLASWSTVSLKGSGGQRPWGVTGSLKSHSSNLTLELDRNADSDPPATPPPTKWPSLCRNTFRRPEHHSSPWEEKLQPIPPL